jgi:hypothetical protein
MGLSVRRQLRALRVYVALNTIVLAVIGTAAFRQASPQRFDESPCSG